MKNFKDVLLNENVNKAKHEAEDFIIDNADAYMSKFGNPSIDMDDTNGGHAKMQKLSAVDIMKKVADFATIDEALKVIGYLFDAGNFKTMDVMGVALFLTKDSFDKAFPEYKK